MQCAGHDARPFRAPAAGEEAAASCAGRGRPAAPRCRLSHAAASPRQGHSLETVNESEGHGAGKHPVPRRLRPARGLARRSPHALLPSQCIMRQFCLRPVTVNGTHSDIPRQATGGTACAGCGGPGWPPRHGSASTCTPIIGNTSYFLMHPGHLQKFISSPRTGSQFKKKQ